MSNRRRPLLDPTVSGRPSPQRNAFLRSLQLHGHRGAFEYTRKLSKRFLASLLAQRLHICLRPAAYLFPTNDFLLTSHEFTKTTKKGAHSSLSVEPMRDPGFESQSALPRPSLQELRSPSDASTAAAQSGANPIRSPLRSNPPARALSICLRIAASSSVRSCGWPVRAIKCSADQPCLELFLARGFGVARCTNLVAAALIASMSACGSSSDDDDSRKPAVQVFVKAGGNVCAIREQELSCRAGARIREGGEFREIRGGGPAAAAPRDTPVPRTSRTSARCEWHTPGFASGRGVP